MSPYLHFGQISPLFNCSQSVRNKSSGTEAFLEELIVRRELSMNFVFIMEDMIPLRRFLNGQKKP